MAFGSTISVTVNAVAKVMNRINQDKYSSEYYLREATQEFRMFIRHSKDAPNKLDGTVLNRHSIDFEQLVFATASTPNIRRKSYLVILNQDGDTIVDPGYVAAGFVDYVDSATVQGDLIAWMS